MKCIHRHGIIICDYSKLWLIVANDCSIYVMEGDYEIQFNYSCTDLTYTLYKNQMRNVSTQSEAKHYKLCIEQFKYFSWVPSGKDYPKSFFFLQNCRLCLSINYCWHQLHATRTFWVPGEIVLRTIWLDKFRIINTAAKAGTNSWLFPACCIQRAFYNYENDIVTSALTTALCGAIHRWPGDCPHKGCATRKEVSWNGILMPWCV